MMAYRKTITVTALHARLKKAIAALPCLRGRSEKASSLRPMGPPGSHSPAGHVRKRMGGLGRSFWGDSNPRGGRPPA
jgi:hypothetical protein